MSAIVEALRQIGRELIDKRLWPVAVVLLAALVAVPALIGGSNRDTAARAAVASADPGAAAAVSQTAEAAGKATTKSKSAKNGTIKDPFFDPPKPPDAQTGAGGGGGAGAGAAVAAGSTAGSTRAEATSPTGAAAPPAAGTAAAKKSTGRAATTPSATPRGTPAPTTTAPPPSYLRTVVRVNGASGGKAHPISRLTPLGGTSDPAALFLGVAKAGGRYAVFVLGPRATSRGQATCKGDTNCRMIGLKAGQTQVVTVRPARGGVQRYILRVETIKRVRSSAARVRTARARVHPDGSRVRRAMRGHEASAAALRTARYDRSAGVLRAVTRDVVKNASE